VIFLWANSLQSQTTRLEYVARAVEMSPRGWQLSRFMEGEGFLRAWLSLNYKTVCMFVCEPTSLSVLPLGLSGWNVACVVRWGCSYGW